MIKNIILVCFLLSFSPLCFPLYLTAVDGFITAYSYCLLFVLTTNFLELYIIYSSYGGFCYF